MVWRTVLSALGDDGYSRAWPVAVLAAIQTSLDTMQRFLVLHLLIPLKTERMKRRDGPISKPQIREPVPGVAFAFRPLRQYSLES